MPYDEKDEILEVATKNDVDVISLIAPTSKERIQMIASEASGFIYVVSRCNSVAIVHGSHRKLHDGSLNSPRKAIFKKQ